MMRRRRGPSLVGAAATTAVVVGTANAVSGKQQAAAQQQAAQQQAAQQQAAQQQAAQQQAAQVVAAAPAAEPPAAPAGFSAEALAQLKQLGDLHAAGVLTDEEFATAKAKLLS